jgi:hypothetical protein
VLTKTGRYTIAVSDLNTNETGGYQLRLERFRPSAPRLLTFGQSVSDTISSRTDIDLFAFDGTIGGDLRILVAAAAVGGSGIGPRVEVRDPDGVRIVDTSCDALGCTVSIDSNQAAPNKLPVLTKSGRYTIAVSDLNTNETGGYNITVQCLFGPCSGP